MPWTVPCWSADPWLKFVVAGTVPIGKGRTISYADPTGDTAARFADRPEERSYPSPTYAVPTGKVAHDAPRYVHNVFDAVFDGMGHYRELVLAGRPQV
jgi:hypothetical protein